MNDDDLKNNTNTPAEPAQEVVEEAKSDAVKTSDVVELTPKADDSGNEDGAQQISSEATEENVESGEPSAVLRTDEPTPEQISDEPVLKEEAEVEASEQSEEVPAEPVAAEPTTDEQPVSAPVVDDNPNAKWYVVHTYSGHENKVAATLKQRIESEHLEDKILDILVPTQDKIEIRSGKKTEVKEKIFPGYILVRMILDDTSWLAVRTTQGVTSFVGIGNKPTPISAAEVATIVKFTTEQAPTFKQVFASDDTVRIVEGPFAEFIGKVDSVDEEKGKVRVLVSIFGRETPVELDFLQVQKI